MNRRNFIKVFTALGVTLCVPFKFAYDQIRYRLYGDGKTDDTEALQALIDGEPVIMPDGKTVQISGVLHLPEGTYMVSDTLNIGRIILKGSK